MHLSSIGLLAAGGGATKVNDNLIMSLSGNLTGVDPSDCLVAKLIGDRGMWSGQDMAGLWQDRA